MQSFKTYWKRCEGVLRNEDFKWPDNVTFVNYPANNTEDDFRVDKP